MLPDLIAYDAGLRPLWVLKLFLWLQELLQILWCMTQPFRVNFSVTVPNRKIYLRINNNLQAMAMVSTPKP